MLLQDEHLLTKVSVGDLIAQDAKYHPKWLVSLYNKAAAVQVRKITLRRSTVVLFWQSCLIIAWMQKQMKVFRLADLVGLYSTRFKKLGTEMHECTNSTHLKNRILETAVTL